MLQCGVCNRGGTIPVVFPLPYVLFDKVYKKRRKGGSNAGREVQLNLLIFGLNNLWGGNHVDRHVRSAVHWSCATEGLKNIFRHLLRWEQKTLIPPVWGAAFAQLVRAPQGRYETLTKDRIVNNHSIDVEKISLPTTKVRIIPFISLLPIRLQAMYASPDEIVSKVKEDWDNMRKVQTSLKMDRKAYVRVLKRLLGLGMIEWRNIQQVRVTNGLQCVKKDANKLRLIFDRRPVNCVFSEPPRVELPSFDLLEEWAVDPNETVWFGKIDLDNYYHRLGVPQWMKDFLGFPSISRCEYTEITGQDHEEQRVGVVSTTLPMGLAHAVSIAQAVHLQTLTLIPQVHLVNQRVSPDSQMWILVYIDDVLIGSKGSLEHEVKYRVESTIKGFLTAYEKAGLMVNTRKLQWASQTMTGLGCVLDGKLGRIRPTPDRLGTVIAATRHALGLEWVGRNALETLLGHWVWLLLLRRSFFSILFNVYRLLQKYPGKARCKFWDSVKREFKLLIWLSGGMYRDWRRPRKGWVIASDASITGGGACETWLPPISWQNMEWEAGGVQNITSTLEGLQWTPVFQQQWCYQEHINVLEARALVTGLTRMLGSPARTADRWMCAVDSLVVMGAVTKFNERLEVASAGRSSRLTAGLTRLSLRAYQLAIQQFRDAVGQVRVKRMDEQLVSYIEAKDPERRKRVAERLLAAIQHFFPELRGTLPISSRYLAQLRRQTHGSTKPPMIREVVSQVAKRLIKKGFPMTALAVMLQFDCLLRPAEVAGIRAEHIVFPGGGVLGCEIHKVLVLLPRTKTGLLQSVDIRDPVVSRYLYKLKTRVPKSALLFPPYRTYAGRLATVLKELGLSYVGYSAHSIRHGGATTDLINQGYKGLTDIMYRGRWESQAGKRYLQRGAASLLYAELPPSFIKEAATALRHIPGLLRHSTLKPGQ